MTEVTDNAAVLTEAERTAEYERYVRVHNLAVDFCNADETYDHVDQTDDHPCTRCRRYAEMADRLAAQPPQDDRDPGCTCTAYTIRTDYGTGVEHELEVQPGCPLHELPQDDPQPDEREAAQEVVHDALHVFGGEGRH